MQDLDDGIGITTLQTKKLNDNQTEYSMYIATKMYRPYSKDFIEIYQKEMSIIKAESERLFSEGK